MGTEETEEERVLMSQLNSVEKYALRFLETQHDFEDLKQAEVNHLSSMIRVATPGDLIIMFRE